MERGKFYVVVKDKIFSAKQRRVEDFNFGKRTAAVFDDMLDRSVPFYAEIQRMIGEIACDFAAEGTNVYDLGCSTCATFLAIDRVVPKNVRFIGVDSSAEMLRKGREKLKKYRVKRPCELIRADLNKPVRIENASLVIMNLTLQFVRPLYRHRLIENVARGMNRDGCLILIEKVLSKDSTLNRLFINYYHAFKKRQGYSRMEISQKREALENILIPYRVEENREVLINGGFSQCDVFFKWYNFCGIIAIK
ncbi:MAG: carboxy-S-adenosyl-L-methionine synthase CmoA [Candidatus Omnitrophica bacterium]|nr:carboxy-S-adenosyl-L-methionine synthase CmoA [Candidatus Omnitrophota bacterium]